MQLHADTSYIRTRITQQDFGYELAKVGRSDGLIGGTQGCGKTLLYYRLRLWFGMLRQDQQGKICLLGESLDKKQDCSKRRTKR